MSEPAYDPVRYVADLRAITSEETDKVSLSLHTYGKHINRTGRSQFDPEAKTEEVYMVSVDEPPHPNSG